MSNIQQESNQFKDKTVKLPSSKISNTSTKSTSKFRNVGDFLWNKFTNSRKNSSTINISKVNTDQLNTIKDVNSITDTTNSKSEKKHRRNLFNIFDSSTAKLKLTSGVHKKNVKNKTSNKNKIPRLEPEVVLVPEPQKENLIQIENKLDVSNVPELDTIKVNLIDNSILKSKISAASRRNTRHRPTTTTTSKPPESNLNNSFSNIKTSLSKMSTGSLAQKMDIIDESPTDVDYEKINDKDLLKNSQTSIVMSSSSSSSSSSSAKKSSHSINIESDSLEMSVQNKSQNNEILKNDSSLDEQNKIAIYDNNITECSTYDDENNENDFDLFKPLPKELKSKSYDKIDVYESTKANLDTNNNHLKDQNTNEININNNPKNYNYIKNNRYSYFDNTKMDKIDFSNVVLRPLTHSRSLKLSQKANENCEKIQSSKTGEDLSDKKLIDTDFKYTIGNFSNSYKIPNSKKRESIVPTNANQEPVWKELAFKKHNAWSKKNFDSVNTSPNERSNQDKLDQNYDQSPFESKVKSIIRDLQKV
ncbi:unnamed protein product [Brachionus calyciflorus]|uniref:Uncharacterized protein n=1 Tax=Brachionus calyciflorus TaxID=104777 RepID=A0A813TBJ3_9BILA|nr:unnamed protein product [Brachionus calyciflorus]